MKRIDLNSLKILNLMERKGLTLVHNGLSFEHHQGKFVAVEKKLYKTTTKMNKEVVLMGSETYPMTEDQMYYLLGKISESEKEMILKQYNDKKIAVQNKQGNASGITVGQMENLLLLETLLFHNYAPKVFVADNCYIIYNGDNLIKVTEKGRYERNGEIINLRTAYLLLENYYNGNQKQVQFYLNSKLKESSERQIGQKYAFDPQLSLRDKLEMELLIGKQKIKFIK